MITTTVHAQEEIITIKFYASNVFEGVEPVVLLHRKNNQWAVENTTNSPIAILYNKNNNQHYIQFDNRSIDQHNLDCYYQLLEKLNAITNDFTLTYTTPALFDLETLYS